MTPPEIFEHPPLDIEPDRIEEILEALYGLSGDISALSGDRDRNYLVDSAQGRFMFKVANPAEDPGNLEMQQRLLQHIQAWDPGLAVPRPLPTIQGEHVGTVDIGGSQAAVRLTSYLPGTTVEHIGWTRQLRRDAATTLARLDLALRTFTDDRLDTKLLWDFTRIRELEPHTVHLTPPRRKVVDAWLAHFDRDVADRLPQLRHQPIHGDFNPANLIVDPDQPDRLAGIIDFGDMTHGPLVADPAIAAAYQCLGAEDPGAVIVDAADQFNRACPIFADEPGLLAKLAITRLVQSVIISAWRATLHPANSEYILIHAEPIWDAIERLPLDNADELAQSVTAVCAASATSGLVPIGEALERRRESLGPGLRLTYERPLHVASARGVWITDTDGVSYLDAYNNVAHVGHGQPDVVAALSRQAVRLNTNTRYLVDRVTEYASRIANMLPEPLNVVLFANSGSEANDLAWRMARTVTGRRGMVVTDHAYHGSTYLTMATSPEELGLTNIEPWVATVPAPRSELAAPTAIDEAVQRLDAADEEIAAYACDTVWSSDGIYEPPPGYLAQLYRRVRSLGGLCIADEIQAGFGRVGTRMWGFGGHDVVPDIVTLGKPMGNGHPIAAVVTSPAIAQRFSESGYYFSTFAGNPVSAAVGSAVLDVMERDRLPEQADRVGSYLRAGLRTMAATHEAITDVRGPGLFIGLEMSDATHAATIQNEMRNRQVLIGRTGPQGNVLKIRPPLVFEEHHAHRLLDTLGGVLASSPATS